MIQVGQVLDKYELLERVGQGGMAVVYRGLDRSLKRTVAVKVLHKHLSDYQEARDRFEREAQAVAKLRHENILEIFDYAAKEGQDSYIVTEFIDGQTLKQFVTERPIAYPEIGAMIVLQVCRALAHAHAGGILHRDVKPENIMIRSDGIVKLMDFGISHMVDLERLTVTGQLLGSPAYMAPEHVEGRPLDFRTDVFAAGIVLYQLTVGKLPFEGKNPHEVLKRIAECKFVDPRQANPRIGNRLGRIILRAMAAAPDGRYPAISEMVLAIEGYLDESGLSKDKVPSELARYFQAPASYELALRERLLDHLARRGQQQLDQDDRSGALDVFDRVLTIDPANAKVLELLGGLNRRARARQIGLAVLACAVVGAGAWAVHERMKPAPPQPPGDPGELGSSGDRPGPVVVHEVVPPAPPDAMQVAAAPLDAPSITHVEPVHTGPAPDAAPAAIATTVNVLPRGSQYALDDGKWQPVPDDGVLQLPLDHPTHIRVRNDRCEPMDQLVKPGQTGVVLQMAFLAGAVVPRCLDPKTGQAMTGVGVLVDGSAAELGKRSLVTFGNTLDTSHPVKIEFIGDHVDHAPITKIVSPAQEITVECVPR